MKVSARLGNKTMIQPPKKWSQEADRMKVSARLSIKNIRQRISQLEKKLKKIEKEETSYKRLT